jgi:hypothetical protein
LILGIIINPGCNVRQLLSCCYRLPLGCRMIEKQPEGH